MALFSRRRKPTDASAAEAPDVPDPAEGEASAVVPAPIADVASEPVEEVHAVGISTSTFRGVGAAVDVPPAEPAAAAPRTAGRADTAEAPEPTESVPGLRDNVLLREAVAALSEPATPIELIGVTRQLLQNHVFLRVKGDARSLLSAGEQLPLAVVTRADKQYVLVYSSGAALQAAVRADGQTDTSAMGQPVMTVLAHVLAGPYAGIVVDGPSATRSAVIPSSVLRQAVDQADPLLRLKTLLAAARTAETGGSIARAMIDTPLWVAVNTSAPDGDGQTRVGIAEARTNDGQRLLELYSHPLEIVAMGRNDRPLPFPVAQVGKALREHPELDGVIVDAAGPWMRLGRDELGPLMAVPDPSA